MSSYAPGGAPSLGSAARCSGSLTGRRSLTAPAWFHSPNLHCRAICCAGVHFGPGTLADCAQVCAACQRRHACLRCTDSTCRKAHLHCMQASHQQPLSCASVKDQADHIEPCAVPRGALQTPVPCAVQALPICKGAHSCDTSGSVLRGAQHKPVSCAALVLPIRRRISTLQQLVEFCWA